MIRARHIGLQIALMASCLFLGTFAQSELPPFMGRATLVYNLSKFVVWPDGAFSGPDAPCTFCLLGRSDLDMEFPLLNGLILNGRSVAFRSVQQLSPPLTCHVLVIGYVEKTDLGAILKRLEGRPIFTISDIPGFAQSGGMIEIVSSGTRVVFYINLDAAKRSDLTINAPLLQIATVIGKTVP